MFPLPLTINGRATCVRSIARAKYFRTRLMRPLLHHDQLRRFGGIPPALLPPVVFGGLVLTLWTWKCLMMVLFQNKIIYMPGLPPNARRETIIDYQNQCGGIEWEEKRIKSSDGTQISLCVASTKHEIVPLRSVCILYFQGWLPASYSVSPQKLTILGNASSLPPRLPFLSPVLRTLGNPSDQNAPAVRYQMVCCSYRGYWTSKGRPSEKGIAKDAKAALDWIMEQLSTGHPPSIIVWGQSIGAGVATALAADVQTSSSNFAINTLILETPFLSIKAMLETLYPQRWLPYRYLWPFLRNHLDTWKALGSLRRDEKQTPKVLLLTAGKDELVPVSHGDELEKRCLELGIDVSRRNIAGALHTEIMVRPEGRHAVIEAVRRAGSHL